MAVAAKGFERQRPGNDARQTETNPMQIANTIAPANDGVVEIKITTPIGVNSAAITAIHVCERPPPNTKFIRRLCEGTSAGTEPSVFGSTTKETEDGNNRQTRI